MNYTLPAFQPIHFVPTDEEVEIRSRQVQAIYVVAHEPLPDGANHWCLYLQTSETTVVSIDATPTYSVPSTILQNGSKANLIITALPYLISTSSHKDVRLSVCAGLTVGRVVDILIQSGRSKYKFNSEGRGCRMWTTDQVTLLRNNGSLPMPRRQRKREMPS